MKRSGLERPVFRRDPKIVKSSCIMSVCPSLRVKQLRSHWKDLIFGYFFEKSVEKIQFSLQSDNNNNYFT